MTMQSEPTLTAQLDTARENLRTLQGRVSALESDLEDVRARVDGAPSREAFAKALTDGEWTSLQLRRAQQTLTDQTTVVAELEGRVAAEGREQDTARLTVARTAVEEQARELGGHVVAVRRGIEHFIESMQQFDQMRHQTRGGISLQGVRIGELVERMRIDLAAAGITDVDVRCEHSGNSGIMRIALEAPVSIPAVLR